LNLWYSWSICYLVLIEYELYRYVKLSLGKNLSRYSPIEAWLIIALVAQAYSEFKWPNCNSHRPPLEYDGSIECKSSSKRSRKLLSLKSNAWKVIFYCERIELHLDFLQKSQEDLHGKDRIDTKFLVSLSTIWWSAHCCLLEQSQNSIQFIEFLEKNSLSSEEIAVECIWYRWIEVLNIFLAIWRESVMTTICFMQGSVTAW